MRRLAALALLLAWAAATPARADDAMRAAANAFYSVYGALPRGGSLPDATGRTRYAAVLSPRLNRMLNEAQAAQVRFDAKVKGAAPPLVEGDIFTSMFEGATGWQVGDCTGDAKAARCPVTLTHTPPAHAAAGQKPAQWHDILVLTRTDAGWKVDDVVYDAGYAFGNTGTLSGMLKMVVAQAPA